MRSEGRQDELDWLRGWMMVLMTVTHMPTWFSAALGQPFGYVSAAEGFVFVSAFLAGSVYARLARERGMAEMRRRLWRRAGWVYLAHLASLAVLALVVLPIALARGAHPVTDLASFYLAHRDTAVAGALLLAYDPPLFDILPMYVAFLLVSPLALSVAMRRGWGTVLAFSLVLWTLAQLGGGAALYHALASLAGLSLPYEQTGAFQWLAWQLAWVSGMAVGASGGDGSRPGEWQGAWQGRGTLWGAAAIALAFFAWRHLDGQVPSALGPEFARAVDKWQLGALRILDFAALAVLFMAVRPRVAAWAKRSPMTFLGRRPLPVFTAHLAFCALALALVGDPAPARLRLEDVVLLAVALAGLFAVAWLVSGLHRPATAVSAQRYGRTVP